MKKYHIKQLGIEITRRCNYNCVHCMRGEAQNVTITPEIIDTMFSQLSQVDTIVLLGGESLLEIDMLEYLLEAIDRYDLKTEMLSFITNGSILDSRVIEIMSDFINRAASMDYLRVAQLAITLDNFHDRVQAEKALNFYQEINSNDRLLVNYADHTDNPTLFYSGNCKEYVDKNFHNLQKAGHKVYHCEGSKRNRQLFIHDDILECEIQLGANGFITPDAQTDYEELDNLSFGDILNESLESIFNRHQRTCIATCDECFNERYLMSYAHFGIETTAEEAIFNRMAHIKALIINSIWRFRELMQKKYPAIHAQDIINLTTMPDDEMYDYLIRFLLLHNVDEKEFYKELQCIRQKYPKATGKQEQRIAALNCIIYWVEILNPDVLMKFLYNYYTQYNAFDELDKLYASFEQAQNEYDTGERTEPKYFIPCALIPDSVDPRNNNEN